MDLFGTAAGFAGQGLNMKFAEEMASSQYQRAVSDMKNAGLNPNAIFGSGGGSPAAAPGGQSSGGSAMGGSSLTELVGTAKQLAETDRIKAGTENEKQENKILQSQTASAQAHAKATTAAAEASEKSDRNFAKSLDNPLLKTVDTFKKYVPIDKMLSAFGNYFGGRASAGQSTPKAASTVGKTGSSAKQHWKNEPRAWGSRRPMDVHVGEYGGDLVRSE